MGLSNATVPKKEFPQQAPLPVGTSKAKVAHTIVKSTKTGKVMFSVKFVDDADRYAWANLVVSPESPKAMDVLSRQMGALGLTESFLNDDDTTTEEIAEAMIGAEALVTVADEEWNGNTYRKVVWIA